MSTAFSRMIYVRRPDAKDDYDSDKKIVAVFSVKLEYPSDPEVAPLEIINTNEGEFSRWTNYYDKSPYGWAKHEGTTNVG